MEDGKILRQDVNINPVVSCEEVKQLVLSLYGFKVLKITELVGYDDKNYHIVVEHYDRKNSHLDILNEDGYVLKIINSLDSKKSQFFEAQNALLLHLRRKHILCPKPIALKDGSHFTKTKLTSGEHIVRLLEFISGTILGKVPCTTNLYFQVGKYVAIVDQALQDFHHPSYDTHHSLWMLESVPELRGFLFAVADPSKRAMAVEIINEFETRVLSSLDKLRRVVIHGDLNEHNIIVEESEGEWRVKAVIDLGDSQLAYDVFELAITMAYMIFLSREVDTGGSVLGGYLSVSRVSDIEYQLLKVCIAARMCQSLVLGAYSLLKNPDNAYIASTSLHGWVTLEKLWKEPEAELLERWINISENKP